MVKSNRTAVVHFFAQLLLTLVTALTNVRSHKRVKKELGKNQTVASQPPSDAVV